MDWREEYKRKLVSAEEAVKVVKSGDRVVCGTHPDQPKVLGGALAARKEELKDVDLVMEMPGGGIPLLQPGMEESFNIILDGYVGDGARPLLDEKRAVYLPDCFSMEFKQYDDRPQERKQVCLLWKS